MHDCRTKRDFSIKFHTSGVKVVPSLASAISTVFVAQGGTSFCGLGAIITLGGCFVVRKGKQGTVSGRVELLFRVFQFLLTLPKVRDGLKRVTNEIR